VTGNVQFAARDYDPTTGVWTQADPLGLGAGDVNDYRFVGGNPVNGTDPTGLWSFKAGWDSLKQSITAGLTGLERTPDFQSGICFGLGWVQGGFNGLNGVTDFAVGTANAGIYYSFNTAALLALAGTGQSLSIPAPDWSNGIVNRLTGTLYVVESDSAHSWSKFLTGNGIVTVGTLGLGALGNSARAAESAVPILQEAGAGAEGVAAEAGVHAPSSIATPYGAAIQEESAAALQMRNQIQQGATVYKGGVLGRSETGASQFLATENPLNPGYASRYGIPPRNSNFD